MLLDQPLELFNGCLHAGRIQVKLFRSHGRRTYSRMAARKSWLRCSARAACVWVTISGA
jgi:hypothetical protein